MTVPGRNSESTGAVIKKFMIREQWKQARNPAHAHIIHHGARDRERERDNSSRKGSIAVSCDDSASGSEHADHAGGKCSSKSLAIKESSREDNGEDGSGGSCASDQGRLLNFADH